MHSFSQKGSRNLKKVEREVLRNHKAKIDSVFNFYVDSLEIKNYKEVYFGFSGDEGHWDVTEQIMKNKSTILNFQEEMLFVRRTEISNNDNYTELDIYTNYLGNSYIIIFRRINGSAMIFRKQLPNTKHQ
ncbi:MAG: hypothetical protein ACLGGV_03360 [Bacteroidia bacterium]